MSRSSLWIIVVTAMTLVLGCARKEEAKPPEKVVNITTAQVVARDLPLTESAVGSETWVSQAQTYDPTSDLARRFYIRLPFPLDIVRRLKIGQPVTLTNFEDNKKTVGVIREIRPALSTMTQTGEVIVDVTNPAGWRPAGRSARRWMSSVARWSSGCAPASCPTWATRPFAPPTSCWRGTAACACKPSSPQPAGRASCSTWRDTTSRCR